MPAESDFLRWLFEQRANRANANVAIPIGDDLAALNFEGGDLLLIGIDQVLDGVHFKLSEHAPKLIGAKAINRNLSDCAAMACLPVAAVASVAVPRGMELETLQEIFVGMREAASRFDCAIVGGDTSAWDGPLAISVAILGRADGIAPITRSGAKAGDVIFVSGALGGSMLGRHLAFEPRIHLARDLSRTGTITAMLDISDGLSRDLSRLCQASGVRAVIDSRTIPIHPDATTLSNVDGRSALQHALNDGEDHELLFTSHARLDRGDCTPIGRIEPADASQPLMQIEHGGVLSPLEPGGWDPRW